MSTENRLAPDRADRVAILVDFGIMSLAYVLRAGARLQHDAEGLV